MGCPIFDRSISRFAVSIIAPLLFLIQPAIVLANMEAPVPISQSKHDKYIIAHGALLLNCSTRTHCRCLATLASVATLITMPLAVLAARCACISTRYAISDSRADLRTWKHWNTVHAIFNITTVVLIIVSFALSNVAVGEAEYTGADADLHHKLGLAVFVIVLVTGVGGIGAKLLTKAVSLPFCSLIYVLIFASRRSIMSHSTREDLCCAIYT